MGKRFFAKQHNTDANQPEIIQALNEIGAVCYEMEQPVDLLVEFDGIWLVLEIKNPDGLNRLTKEQEKFFEVTTAPAFVVRSSAEAVKAARSASRRSRKRK